VAGIGAVVVAVGLVAAQAARSDRVAPTPTTAAPHRAPVPPLRVFVTRPNAFASTPPCAPCLAPQRAPQPLPTSSPPATTTATVVVDASQRFQSIDGFGFALTDSAANVLARLPKVRRDAVLRSLFTTDDGIGVSWVRIIMGPSDFTPVSPPWYSYRETQDARFDVGRSRPGAAHGDFSYIVPLLREARRLAHGDVKFFANPHSAPGWMKQNGGMEAVDPQRGTHVEESCLLGYCPNTPPGQDFRDDYVRYFVDFVRTYEAKGIPIYALGIQNEPYAPADYPGGHFTPADQIDFIARLDRALRAEHLTLRPQLWAELDSAQSSLLLTAAGAQGNRVDGLSFHCYYLNDAIAASMYAGLDTFHLHFPDRSIHSTECTRDSTERWADTIDIVIDHTRHWVNSSANWNIALDPHGGPSSHLCPPDQPQCTRVSGTTMSAPVIVSGRGPAARASYTREYYEMGQVSRFVRPGAVHIGSTAVDGLHNVAFENRDGSRVLVVHNTGTTRRQFVVVESGRRYSVQLAPGMIATYIWAPRAR
jgi:glucosylceramidase